MGKDEPELEDRLSANQEERRGEVSGEVRSKPDQWPRAIEKGRGFKQEASRVSAGLHDVLGMDRTGYFKGGRGAGSPATRF